MTAFQRALIKIKESKTQELTGYPESVSPRDAFIWLSGYIAALRENDLIDDNDFAVLRDELRKGP